MIVFPQVYNGSYFIDHSMCAVMKCGRPHHILLLQVHHKSLSLGEVLDGDRMAESLYHIRFRENVDKKTLCQLTLSENQVCY